MNVDTEQAVETVRIITSSLWDDYYVYAATLSTLLTEKGVGPKAVLVGMEGNGLDMLREFVSEFRWSKIAVVEDLSATQAGDLNVFFMFKDDNNVKSMIESLSSEAGNASNVIFLVPSD